MKDKVYADAPESIQELKEKIHAVIDEIEPKMSENVMEISSKEHGPAKVAVEAIWMILFFIIEGKPSAIEWNKNQIIFHKKHAFCL